MRSLSSVLGIVSVELNSKFVIGEKGFILNHSSIAVASYVNPSGRFKKLIRATEQLKDLRAIGKAAQEVQGENDSVANISFTPFISHPDQEMNQRLKSI